MTDRNLESLKSLARTFRSTMDALCAVCSVIGFHEEYEQDGNGVTWSVCFHPNGREDMSVLFEKPGWEYCGQTHFTGYCREEAAVDALKTMTSGFRCFSPQAGLDVDVPPFRTVEELKMKLGVAGRLTSPAEMVQFLQDKEDQTHERRVQRLVRHQHGPRGRVQEEGPRQAREKD